MALLLRLWLLLPGFGRGALPHFGLALQLQWRQLCLVVAIDALLTVHVLGAWRLGRDEGQRQRAAGGESAGLLEVVAAVGRAALRLSERIGNHGVQVEESAAVPKAQRPKRRTNVPFRDLILGQTDVAVRCSALPNGRRAALRSAPEYRSFASDGWKEGEKLTQLPCPILQSAISLQSPIVESAFCI
eukprot:scaffold1272_cov250-Pinguiococcus_pyrenoidosus.AAC.3